MSMNYMDVQAYNALTQRAQAAAQASYYDSLSKGASASQALQQAQFEWQKQLDVANQTGMWNGQYNMPTEQWFSGQFGQWYGPGGSPAAGTQTLQGQQQQWQQAYDLGQLYGQYYAPGTAPTAGQSTLQAQQQAADLANQQAQLTGWYYAPTGQGGAVGAPGTAAGQGTQTLAGQQQQWQQGFSEQQFAAQQQQQAQQNALNYLQMLSQLRGPADWAKYQQVLGSTPGGMRDLVAAAMGQYTPGGGATTGAQPQAVNLNTMQQQIAGTPGSSQVWGSGLGVGQQPMTSDQAQQATGNGTNTYNLPAPNQISAQSWNNMAPSQQQMLLGMYEANGWDKNDVQALYNQSLPKYGTNSPTAGTWRLQ